MSATPDRATMAREIRELVENASLCADAVTFWRRDGGRVEPELEVAKAKAAATLHSYLAAHASAIADALDGVTRVIDGKFVVKGGQIVKASSGEVVPEDEPLVLMRGRDRLALPTLGHYRKLNELDGCNDFQLGLVDELLAKFAAYAADPKRMKQPGITRGAAWTAPISAPTEGDE